MNYSDFFANPLQTVNFISVYSSIITIADFFYDQKLLTFEDTSKPIDIVNALCDYLYKDSDNIRIVNLGHELFNNSGLYKSGDNETNHLEYINAMVDNIIATAIFAKYVNTFGYLSTIVHSTRNLTLSFFKKKIVADLKNQQYLNEDGTISKLTDLTISTVTERLIFPLFPRSEHDMKIIDFDYIYAQAGSMLARIAGMDPNNFTINEYITMSQTIEQAVLHGEMNQEALKIFQLPALLYFTHKRKDNLEKQRVEHVISDPQFWDDAFNLLFSDLNVGFDRIIKSQENNSAYQFQMAFFGYKNRTELAGDTMKKLCSPSNPSDYAEEVEDYKFYHDSYYCKGEKKRQLPDLNVLFSLQNEHIANKYFLFEKDLIREAFGYESMMFLERPNVSAFSAILYEESSYYAVIPYHTLELKDSIDLFILKNGGKHSYLCALVRGENGMTLLSFQKDMEGFLQKIGLGGRKRFKVIPLHPPIKSGSQTFDTFATNIAERRRKNFLEMLQNQGYDSTTEETLLKFLKSLIPFYPCVKASEKGDSYEIFSICMLDSLSLIPGVGHVAKLSSKFANVVVKTLFLSLGTSMKTFITRQTISLALGTEIRGLALTLSEELSKMFTKDLFKDIAISVLRSSDPGIELSVTLGKVGIEAMKKCFTMVVRKLPSLKRVLQSLKNLKQIFPKKVDKFSSHDAFVDSNSGKDAYVQKIERRRIIGSGSEQPVVLMSDAKKGKRIYQRIDPETGKLDGKDLLVRNDVLISAPPSLPVRIKNIKLKGLSGRGKLPDERVETRDILSQYVWDDAGKNALNFVDDLRYESYLEDSKLNQKEAVKRIFDAYREDYTRSVVALDPNLMFQAYSQNNLHSILTFDDYYAIRNYLSTGSSRVNFETIEALWMKRAMYRLAFRLTDKSVDSSPKILYGIGQRKSNDFKLIKPGRTMTTNSLCTYKLEPYTLSQYSDKISDVERFSEIHYQIKLDNPYLAVDVYKFFPTIDEYVVLLPGIKMTVEKADYELLINGDIAYKVYLKNVPISKSEWLTRLTIDIKLLNDWEDQFRFSSAIDDFDLDLLN